MSNPWTAKLGCFGYLFLVGLCSLPAQLLGLGEGVSMASGLVISTIVLVLVGIGNRRARIDEMREGGLR